MFEDYVIYIGIGFLLIGGLIWAFAPVYERGKVEEPKLDPVVPTPTPVVEEVKPAPVASLEPVVDKAQEEVKANIDAKIEEAFVKAMETETKVETPAPAKKAPAKKKVAAPAKKAPAKKVTKK